ncbi:NADPH-dependent oxidoreductase [Peribacillus cavernae]|uniref:NADPH-dependent oxidoreductase n=1 Tax=Peribacillus cavernae TaxID=1674310 RepID=A0A3S0UG65_9BACI|nr:NADPH-dependent FMN reductase [Peribacillus cavernae]MDQ0218650.1 FMN reductase/FAD reductase [NAD(P)H] [Peribacillus cavernae]RUQ30878.1 NADPH-dependent oxidoreductase [Peribacillus cavernae]
MVKVLGISGSLTPRSKTIIIVEEVLKRATMQDPSIQAEMLDLREYDMQFCNGRKAVDYNEDTQKIIQKVLEADCFVIGTPVYQGSLSGALKNLIDLVPLEAFRKKVVGLIATGGTYQHFLVIENQLKPIFGYFRSYVAPSYVYSHDSHFNSSKEIIDVSVQQRIDDLGKEVVEMHTRFNNGHRAQISQG